MAQSDQSVVDLTSDESAGEQTSQGVRIKMESEFPTVDPNAADVPTKDILDTPAPVPELGRGRRVRKQTQIFSPGSRVSHMMTRHMGTYT